jgi:catechol 2,3-dioxygenase-like lactoylglutathione lyase family enzyme
MISHIDHIVLTVADIDRSVAFYQRVLLMKAVTFAQGRKALTFGNQKINLQTLGQEPRNKAQVGSGDLCLITHWSFNKTR